MTPDSHHIWYLPRELPERVVLTTWGTVLVTGAGGLIGSRITSQLRRLGARPISVCKLDAAQAARRSAAGCPVHPDNDGQLRASAGWLPEHIGYRPGHKIADGIRCSEHRTLTAHDGATATGFAQALTELSHRSRARRGSHSAQSRAGRHLAVRMAPDRERAARCRYGRLAQLESDSDFLPSAVAPAHPPTASVRPADERIPPEAGLPPGRHPRSGRTRAAP
ncbi:hypothetical protein C7C46_12885 [Streptomyces tateyamensis]|uniref:Uncharacterized protein n=1 Tax=Streptomyces tateyamensis TaxID=565073 RepID=A0A2V4N8S8_9ACTN|nr:hypothetical protein C7C46_12885 [Streptomyces tateyamensis]